MTITTEERQAAEAAALEVYGQHIDAAAAKTAEAREAERITAQLEALTQELAMMSKTPSRYDRATIRAKQDEHEALYKRLVELGAAGEVGKQHKPAIAFSVVGGQILRNF